MRAPLAALLAALVVAGPAGAAPESPWTEWGSPLTITQGGTYRGSWESASPSVAAVRIATAEPVIITGRVRNLTGGPLVDAVDARGARVTLEHVFAYGGPTAETSGRFFQAEQFESVTIRNCTIENTRGIELSLGAPGSRVRITRNRHRNVQGNGVRPVGNFVQLRVVQASNIEIAWNEVINDHGKSYPEDIISLYHTSNAWIHDNMLWHQSTPDNVYGSSSQGGITLDAASPGPGAHNNVIARNQVVDGMGISAFVVTGGSGNSIVQNRIVADEFLPTGARKNNGGGAPLSILPGGRDNHAHGNVVGYINRDRGRRSFDLTGASEGAVIESRNNTRVAGRITRATERREWNLWLRKLKRHEVRVGA